MEGLEHLFSEVNLEGNREDLESPQAARNKKAKIKKDDDLQKGACEELASQKKERASKLGSRGRGEKSRTPIKRKK